MTIDDSWNKYQDSRNPWAKYQEFNRDMKRWFNQFYMRGAWPMTEDISSVGESPTTQIISILGCVVSRDKIFQFKKQRVCYGTKLNVEGYNPRNLTDCKLTNSGLDYVGLDFKVCPFCAGSIWTAHEERIDGGTGVLLVDPPIQIGEFEITFDIDRLRVYCLTGNPEHADSQWVVGHVIAVGDFGHKNIDEKYWRSKLKTPLAERGVWRDHSFGIHRLETIITNETDETA